MAGARARAHGEHPVEQHDALLEPRRQVTVRRRRQAEVGAELLVDVLQRARDRTHVGRDAEREPHRVARRRVRVLPDDEHPHVGQRQREGPQHAVAGRAGSRDRPPPRRAGTHPSRRSCPPPARAPGPTSGGRGRQGVGLARPHATPAPGATESTPMNLTLRGPALVDDTVLPDVLVQIEGERIAAVDPGLTPGDAPPPGADAAERVERDDGCRHTSTSTATAAGAPRSPTCATTPRPRPPSTTTPTGRRACSPASSR